MQAAEPDMPDAAALLTSRLHATVVHQDWQSAHDRLMRALGEGSGCVALLGPPGTGKTLLLRRVARTLAEQGRAVTLVERGDCPFGLEQGGVVLVDEAARMDPARMDQVAAAACSVVLAALPGFASRLAPDARRVDLAPLSAAASRRFVAEWLRQTGQDPQLLTEPAVLQLSVHAAGIPRLLVQLLKAALFLAGLDGTRRITAADMDEVAAFRADVLAGAAEPLSRQTLNDGTIDRLYGIKPDRAPAPAPDLASCAALPGPATPLPPASPTAAPARARLFRRWRLGLRATLAAAAFAASVAIPAAPVGRRALQVLHAMLSPAPASGSTHGPE